MPDPVGSIERLTDAFTDDYTPMSDSTQKYTAPNPRYRFVENDTNSTSYSDYDPQDGPVYVIEADETDDAWIQSTHPVDVTP